MSSLSNAKMPSLKDKLLAQEQVVSESVKSEGRKKKLSVKNEK